MAATPSSEISVYYDAPILHMSSKTPTSEIPAAADTVEPPAPKLTPEVAPVIAGKTHTEHPAASTLPGAEPENIAERAEGTDVVSPNGIPEPMSSPASSLSHKGHVRGATIGHAPSVGQRSIFTNADGQTVAGSTFINGAGTTGPNATAEYNDSLHQRAASADAALTEEQRVKLAKSGSKSNKQLAKIIKSEAKVEKKALNIAVKELAELQKMQKVAVKREEKAQTVYNKTLSEFQKHEAAFLAARSKYEASQALLTSNTEALEVSRNNAKEATASLQDKSQEVDSLRKMFDVDEKERELKLVELTGKGSTRSRWSIIG